MGGPEFIKADWIKDGAVVVDAGYHPGGLGGWVELEPLLSLISLILRSGGVGPMTINTLILQCIMAEKSSANIKLIYFGANLMSNPSLSLDSLVAHRGFQSRYPETLFSH